MKTNKKLTLVITAILLLSTLTALIPTVQAIDPFPAKINVSSDGTPVPSPTLDLGKHYKIIAKKVFMYDYPNKLAADAMYYTTGPDQWQWTNHFPEPNGHSFLQINGQDVNWGPFSNGDKYHRYAINYLGEGEALSFQIVDWMDGDWSNNECHISVKIFEVEPPVTPSIDLEKYVSVDDQSTWVDADVTTGPQATPGESVYFKFDIYNDGNVPLSSVTLSDTDFSFGTYTPSTSEGYTLSTDDIVFDDPIEPGETYPVIIGPISAVSGQHTNTGTVEGTYDATPYTDTDDANYIGVPEQPEFLLELKTLALEIVSEIDTDIYRLDYKNSLIESYIQKSLNPDLWVDPEHLDPAMGWLVFKYEFMACNHMKILMADYPDEPVVDVYMEACSLLVEADRQLAELLMNEAMALAPPEGTPERSIYDTYFAKASMYYDQGLAYWDAGDCCRAILQFEYSWLQSKTIVQRFS